MHRGGHLAHCGGDLIGLQLLAVDALARLLGRCRKRLGRTGYLRHTALQAADHLAQVAGHALHGCEQLANLVAAILLDAYPEVASGDGFSQADDPLERTHDGQANHERRTEAEQQGQGRCGNDQAAAGLTLGLHAQALGFQGQFDLLQQLLDLSDQLPVNLLLLLQLAGVLLQALVEGIDVDHHLAEHRGITGVLQCIAQLGSQCLCLAGLGDFALLVGIAAPAGLQALARLVQRLQQQLVNLADLAGLQHRIAALLALGALEQVDAILGESFLQ